MKRESIVQAVLDEIDRRIKENIQADELAHLIGYSTHYLRRIFLEQTGMSMMNYITRRKLEYALFDLSQGGRIIDAAMDYGFETHAGFTKAFKRIYGCPPSLYRLHICVSPPEKVSAGMIRPKQGGNVMNVQIKEITPFTIVGYTSRHKMPSVRNLSDIPAYWDKINLEYGAALTTLHHTYPKSHHCEIAVCFDHDADEESFTYMLGVMADKADSDVPQRPGTYLLRMEGGMYAVFTTPRVDEGQYVQTIHDTWKAILENWLPNSDYEYDNTRKEYEYYDERDHGDTAQMDICIPIRKQA